MNELELIKKINKLKKEKNAIILAHYYQRPEIQDIADFVGDSLALSRKASNTSADMIIFCGVHFMAETAKILSPKKKVLIPAKDADCFMARMIDYDSLKKYKEENKDTVIICYVNSTADVKALADVCVTSSNAISIIKHYSDLGCKMMYCPDQNLGKYAMKKYGYKMDVWNGFCPIHHNATPQMYYEVKKSNPNALFIAHPECQLSVLGFADYVGSTKQLIDYVLASPNDDFIVGTEVGVIYQMEKLAPNKRFIPLYSNFSCKNMKLTTLENLYDTMLYEKNEILLNDDIMVNAKKSLDKMLELSK